MCRIVSWHGRLQATCLPRLNFLQNLVQDGIALAQLLVVLQTLRHTGEQKKQKQTFARATRVGRTGFGDQMFRRRPPQALRPAESVSSSSVPPARLSSVNSGGRNQPECLLLARFQIPGYGRDATEARISTQKGACCMHGRGGMAGLQPSASPSHGRGLP